MSRLSALLALVTSASCTGSVLHVLAAPQPHLRPRQSGGNSSDGNPTRSNQMQIWIPLVVVAAIFVVGTIFACCGRRFRHAGLLGWGSRSTQAAGTATRELTADQLVDSPGGNNGTGAGAGATRGRRPRRTRRTPSQISTHSLPAYMKEPGDQEIVIVRGADELEDDIPITVEMPPLDEHATETPRGSIDISAPSSMYTPMPHSATDVPLLHNDDHGSQQHLSPPALGTRASFDSIVSSAENSAPHYADAAPPYETVVLDDPAPITTSRTSQPSPENERTSTDQQGTGSTRRRSVFASIFNPRNSRLGPPVPPSAPPVPPTAPSPSPEPRSSTSHALSDSRPSLSSDRDPRRSRILHHRPSHSGSGSMFSLLSRSRSNGNLGGGIEGLTSPSMISLHSISSPLTHTLVKTEFTYPKNGPTPDQLRLISSRESFARFGRPYGPDAIAYAASTSRIELDPPPGFEEIAAGSSGVGVGSSTEGRGSPSSGYGEEVESSQANSTSSSASAHIPAGDEAVGAHILPDVTEVMESPVALGNADSAIQRSWSPAEDRNSAADAASMPTASRAPTAEDAPASSSPQPVPIVSLPAASLSSKPATPPSPSGSAPLVSPPVTSSSKAPPSAFKSAWIGTPTDNSFPARAASRASSFMSFATAEEGDFHSPTPYESQLDLEGYESAVETPVNLTAPPTPRMEPRHVHEETDMTITPQR